MSSPFGLEKADFQGKQAIAAKYIRHAVGIEMMKQMQNTTDHRLSYSR